MKALAKPILDVLKRFHPAWVMAILVAAIIAWQSPNIIREVLKGFQGNERAQLFSKPPRKTKRQ
jgi:hypothetical protein